MYKQNLFITKVGQISFLFTVEGLMEFTSVVEVRITEGIYRYAAFKSFNFE